PAPVATAWHEDPQDREEPGKAPPPAHLDGRDPPGFGGRGGGFGVSLPWMGDLRKYWGVTYDGGRGVPAFSVGSGWGSWEGGPALHLGSVWGSWSHFNGGCSWGGSCLTLGARLGRGLIPQGGAQGHSPPHHHPPDTSPTPLPQATHPPMAPPPPPPALPVPPVARAPRGGPPRLLPAVITLLSVAAVGACPAVCRCSGGRVYCNDRGLTAVPEGLPPGATTLFLQNNRIGDAGIPARLGRLPALRVLYLYANALEQLPAHLPPALRELHLQENNVRGLCRRALARAPLLERLHLDDNSVSAAGIEEDAFAENRRLRLLFLSRNHLSSVPAGLPPALEELRLDDNRIHTIPLRAFEGLPALRRLVLDGNLLANQRMADDTFSRLGNLSELSLGRNALAAPPANLPRARLRRLSLAANAISHVPAGALARMRALERLD
ncbi:hypothetical protein DV515_00019829, partial [Chloebia gouldiae]